MTDTSDPSRELTERYRRVRQASLDLCRTLELEDFSLQAMPEVSPPKWHLAHTSWFFETFILKIFSPGYQVFDERFGVMFNSYYNAIGEQYPRAQRGLLSRPLLEEVLAYRDRIDQQMIALLQRQETAESVEVRRLCELGLNHEQQHQELLCTDIKYSFSFNPLYPAMVSAPESQSPQIEPMRYESIEAHDAIIGYAGDRFHFDNESPAHRHHLAAYEIADRVVSNAEYLQFVEEGGYSRADLWLADAWVWLQQNRITKPCYWYEIDGVWFEYTLYGLRELDGASPLCHINYYEADAYARWCGKRLPTEHEWESACLRQAVSPSTDGVSAAGIGMHPTFSGSDGAIGQAFGCVWQWTQSAYSAYPGYRPDAGAIGEYNGKFMSNQVVLRGSSCVTPAGHARTSYRNFFYPKDRWQFSGIRLADSLE